MLFITNRTPKQSARSKRGRHISFDSNNVSVSQISISVSEMGKMITLKS